MAAPVAVGGGVEKKQEEGPLPPVIALPVASFPDAISRMDAGVPRKARTARLRAIPSGWWAFRLPVPRPKAENPRPQRSRVRLQAPSPPDFDAAAPAAKKPRRCLQCFAEVTPQWRSGPMGRCTLCNACGVRLKAVGALREAEHRPPAAKARKVAKAPPPGRPAVVSPPDNQIHKRRHGAPMEDVYLLRKQPNQESRPPEAETYLVRKKKPAKKPWKPRNTGQKCHHCGTTSTPQWREGPMGRHTLCNACGVRYRQGRLLPEYRPAASPTFVASQHASRHREVLVLHQQQHKDKEEPAPVGEGSSLTNQRVDSGSGDAPGSDGDDPYNVVLMRRQLPADKDRYPPTPLHCPLPQPVVEDDPRAGGKNDSTAGAATSGCQGGAELMDAPELDPLLLNGPSAPLLVDSDDFVVD